MRALLYKDLVVHRGKTLPLWGAAGLACLLPAWLPMEGMLLPLVFGLTLPLLLFQQEAKEGWYQLVSQLPFAPRTVVGARYLVTALLCLWMGGCYGLGQAVSPPHPGLESCLAAGALAAAILLTLHAVALPLLYAFGPGKPSPPCWPPWAWPLWCRGWPFPSTRPPSSGWPAALCPFLERGQPCSWFRCPSRWGGMPAGGGEGCLERSVLG